MKKFTNESLDEIIQYLNTQFKNQNEVGIEVLNPDLGFELFAGESVVFDDETFIYRSYKAWSDLAELLYCKLLTPLITSKYTICIKLKKIDTKDSFHNSKYDETNEKYGEESTFFRINKNEEPAFYHYYKQALLNAKVSERKSILNLGINKADEFKTIKNLIDKENFENKKFTGIDFSTSAISFAKNRFSQDNFDFFVHDINKLDELNLPKFDLIVSIGTLQSSSLNFKETFMSLVQNYLNKDGAIILGFPNCRWIGSEMIYSAKVPNYSFPEQSLLYKDVIFCKKYLQQKKYRVTITGKNYVFLVATSIKK